jgi:hypothetical protein
MIFTSRQYMILLTLSLVIAVLGCGCTSSGSTNSDSSNTGTVASPSDDSGSRSSYDDIAGTYVNADNPDAYITLNRDGTGTVETGLTRIDGSIYMENGVLKIGDGTSLGAYPIQDGMLTYKGMTFKKK